MLKTVAGHRWQLVGWTLIIWRAVNTIRHDYPSPREVNLGLQEYNCHQQSIRAVQEDSGISGKSVFPIRDGLPKVWQLIKRTYTKWNEDHAPGLGAALSYYTLFSLAPLLMIGDCSKEVRKLLNEGVNPNAAVGCKDRDTDIIDKGQM